MRKRTRLREGTAARTLLLCVALAALLCPDGLASDEEATQVAMFVGGQRHPSALPPGESPAAKPPLPSAERDGADASLFTLGAGDALKVTVWGYPELSEEIAILPDGTVSYPLIGTVQVGGLTAQELGAAIGNGLASHVLGPPQVSVVVTQMRSRSFSVMGEVNDAGTYPLWNGHVTLLDAIAQAGGLTSAALPAELKIFRPAGDGRQEAIRVDLAALLQRETGDAHLAIQPGDVVYVPSQMMRRKVCVLGQVKAPGLYTLSPDMTVVEALTAAGWALPSGVLESVMVIRRVAQDEPRFVKLNARRVITKQDWTQDPALQPGDIVYVPERFIAKVGDFISFFTSTVEPVAQSYLSVYDATSPATYLVDR